MGERIAEAREETSRHAKQIRPRWAEHPGHRRRRRQRHDADVLSTSAKPLRQLQASAASTTPPSAPSRRRARQAPDKSRRRSSARTGSTRPTGSIAITASASTRSLSGGEGGMLDLSLDPKLAWALKNRDKLPRRRQHRRPRNAPARARPRRPKAVDRIIIRPPPHQRCASKTSAASAPASSVYAPSSSPPTGRPTAPPPTAHQPARTAHPAAKRQMSLI